ncbi:hypothetical protein EVAR_97360_1 [Eumeta japonica]|uniref:Uncharacterized protein n=1 Tax=Eumeta variegata TaxID=151549 RepID=A0A4C1YV41_EUMVA|nr:hypothetical protein EVAR_97360_1 [Eumeta japonica]
MDNSRTLQYNAQNSAAVKIVTKASQWRKIGRGGRRRKSRGVLNLRITSFVSNSDRQSLVRYTICGNLNKPSTEQSRSAERSGRRRKLQGPLPRAPRGVSVGAAYTDIHFNSDRPYYYYITSIPYEYIHVAGIGHIVSHASEKPHCRGSNRSNEHTAKEDTSHTNPEGPHASTGPIAEGRRAERVFTWAARRQVLALSGVSGGLLGAHHGGEVSARRRGRTWSGRGAGATQRARYTSPRRRATPRGELAADAPRRPTARPREFPTIRKYSS